MTEHMPRNYHYIPEEEIKEAASPQQQWNVVPEQRPQIHHQQPAYQHVYPAAGGDSVVQNPFGG